MTARLDKFRGIYIGGNRDPKLIEKRDALLLALLKEHPGLDINPSVTPAVQAGPSLHGVSGGTAAQHTGTKPLAMAADTKATLAFVAGKVRIDVSQEITDTADLVPLHLAAYQASLRLWEAEHQPDHDLIRNASALIQEVNRLKDAGTISKADKAAAYDHAATLLRQGIGIDDNTWGAAKSGIRKMGHMDATDGLAHLAVTGAFAAAIGADAVPEGVKNYIKYPLTAFSNTLLNAFSQVGLNALEDVATRNHGVPVMASNIASSPRLMDLSPNIMSTIRDVRDTLDALRNNPADQTLIEKLRTLDKSLKQHQTDYKLKIASAKTYLEKYRRTLPYRILVAMPSTIALVAASGKIPAALPIGFALAVVNQMVIIGLAGPDEVTKMEHILLSNAKYGDFMVTDEEGNPVLENGVPKVDDAKIRAMWSHPVDKVQAEVMLVMTEELAGRYRELNKAEKARNRSRDDEQRQARLEVVNDCRQKIQRLQEDIIHFTEGIDAIRTGRRGAQWSRMKTDGTIAKMLTSKREYVKQLTAVRLKRPGEFLSELGDRVYGTAALRLVGLAIEDGARAEDVAEPSRQAISQAGILGSAVVANPTAKHFKATAARQKYFPDGPGGESTTPRRSYYGRRYATPGAFKSHVDLQIEGRETPLRLDLTKTDAWAKHTNSWAHRNISSASAFAGNIARNSGEVIATPAALHAASRSYATARKLRDDIARTLNENVEQAERRAADTERGANDTLWRTLSGQLDDTASNAAQAFETLRRQIRETAELLAYRAGMRDADLSFLTVAGDATQAPVGDDGQIQHDADSGRIGRIGRPPTDRIKLPVVLEESTQAPEPGAVEPEVPGGLQGQKSDDLPLDMEFGNLPDEIDAAFNQLNRGLTAAVNQLASSRAGYLTDVREILASLESPRRPAEEGTSGRSA